MDNKLEVVTEKFMPAILKANAVKAVDDDISIPFCTCEEDPINSSKIICRHCMIRASSAGVLSADASNGL